MSTEKEVKTPLIDLAERATVKMVRLVFRAARAVVKQFKELVRDSGRVGFKA